MKNIPVFTTGHGAASLILKEIPYRREAFIHMQDTLAPCALLAECFDFCRACGAERVFATGNDYLERFRLHTAMWEMSGSMDPDPEQTDNLWPVTEQTVSRWREIYNRRMGRVDNAGTLEARDEKRILESGSAYFVHQSGELLGIGWLIDDRLECVAAVRRGAGDRVLRTLLSTCPNRMMHLTVASTNDPAISLYERNGFLKVRENSRWYEVKKDQM